MPALSREELEADMMRWWDELQRNKRPLEKREIQVEIQTFIVKEEGPAIAPDPPDELIQE